MGCKVVVPDSTHQKLQSILAREARRVDVFAENAWHWVALEIDCHPEAGLIYSDEDKIDVVGARSPAASLRFRTLNHTQRMLRAARSRIIFGERGEWGAWNLVRKISNPIV